MKKFLCLLALLCLTASSFGQQSKKIQPLYIGGKLPDITFRHVINYKDTVARLSDFQGAKKKLIIFDFWFTQCTTCVALFAKEDSLQKAFAGDVQFVMVTYEPQKTIEAFLSGWEKVHHTGLSIPIVTGDSLLTNKYIRVFYEPQFAFVDYTNHLVAQASASFLNKKVIQGWVDMANKAKAKDEAARLSREQEKKLQNNNRINP